MDPLNAQLVDEEKESLNRYSLRSSPRRKILPGKSLESNGSILVTATNGFSTPPFMLGEPRILSAVLETGDTTQKI